MRVKLRKEKQRELIDIAKRKQNFTWSMLADRLGISGIYLRNELRHGIRTLSHEVFEKLCELADKDYQGFVKKRLPSNWGQIKVA